MRKRGWVLLALILTVVLPAVGCRTTEGGEPGQHSQIDYVFVHGLSGWGSYDKTYRNMPYWGMLGGDLMQYLGSRGFSCYAASVSPEDSAWDRACELYAQLAGTVTDYGEEHSERCGHPRFGRDFSSDPLIPDWETGRRIVLLGHSFGGATIRVFSELLANGSPEEMAVSGPSGTSPLFLGGQGSRIHAIITLAAPTNGTTAYDLYEDDTFDIESVEVSGWDEWTGNLFSSRKAAERDGRVESDYAAFDMHIDNALALNDSITTLETVYYFAFPCSATEPGEDGNAHPVRKRMEAMFVRSSLRMGAYTGMTKGGFTIDESWKENDGLVNTISAGAPFGAPSERFEGGEIRPGVWYVMPVIRGDHMCLQGGMMKRIDIRSFYLNLLKEIDTLPPS